MKSLLQYIIFQIIIFDVRIARVTLWLIIHECPKIKNVKLKFVLTTYINEIGAIFIKPNLQQAQIIPLLVFSIALFFLQKEDIFLFYVLTPIA